MKRTVEYQGDSGGKKAMNKPNIIICMCDQLRAFETGCYGNAVIRTPNVDRLASGGVRFETAATNFPVCMAARSVLLAGQYNRACTGGAANVCFQNRPGDFNMPEYPYPGRPHLKAPTLPERLRSEGYHTAAIGKWHIHSWPGDIGFDYYLIPRVHHCHSGQLFTENGGPEFAPDGYSVDFEAQRVEQFLKGRRGQTSPFFLYYNISPPHCPLDDAPEKFRAMYRPEDVPLRANVDPDRPLKDQDYWFKVYRWDYRYYNLHLPYTEKLPEGYTLRHLIAEYYGMTTWMDSAVGRMLDALESADLADDTIVVFTSDHGDNLGSNGLVQKGGPNEESIRIPLIIRRPGPRSAACVVRTHVAGLVDIAPTLLSAIGAGVPRHFHGRDLSAALRVEEISAETCAFVETQGGAAVRTLRHMYCLPYSGAGRTLADKPSQFFDLEKDPYQLHNLAGEPGHDEVRHDLDARLRKWDAAVPWMPACDGEN
ncbi:MAG: sulfatase-like hydrolase/transferase [Planctomycetes bacterium]|nr:sulfatase-like hydrolase/transferase [Planctomycetota bacterium]